jgi:hypothetical protein
MRVLLGYYSILIWISLGYYSEDISTSKIFNTPDNIKKVMRCRGLYLRGRIR